MIFYRKQEKENSRDWKTTMFGFDNNYDFSFCLRNALVHAGTPWCGHVIKSCNTYTRGLNYSSWLVVFFHAYIKTTIACLPSLKLQACFILKRPTTAQQMQQIYSGISKWNRNRRPSYKPLKHGYAQCYMLPW